MQTVIRPITVAIAVLSLAGPAFAGPPGKRVGDQHVPDDRSARQRGRGKASQV